MTDDFMKDFDILSPPKRIAKLGGEEIDVTIIPVRAALKFIDFSKKYSVESIQSMNPGTFDSSMFEAVLEVVELICKRSSPKITKDWLYDNVDIKVLMEFVQYLFAGINNIGDDGTGAENTKNSTSGT